MPLSRTRFLARARQASTSTARLRGQRVDRGCVVDLALEPALGRVVEDGAADGEALDDAATRAAAGTMRISSSCGADRPSSTTPRQ